MHTGITGEPTATFPAGPPPEWTYHLHVGDLVAYWVYLCGHARHLLPPAVLNQLTWPLGALPGLAAGLLALIVVVAVGDARPSGWPTTASIAVLVAGFVGSICLVQLIGKRPGPFVEGRKGLAFCRWVCLLRLAELARRHAKDGALDTAATWRFSMTAEGFTLLTEREESLAGIVTVAGKRIQGPWAVLEHVGGTGSHLFLTARDGTAFIVPRGDVPEGAFHDLIVTATRYHRAAVEGGPPATGIVLRVEPVPGGPRLSEGIVRQEDRIAR